MIVDFLWLGAVFVSFVVAVGRTKSTPSPSLGIGLEFDNILLSLVIVIVV